MDAFDNIAPLAPYTDSRPSLDIFTAATLEKQTFPEIGYMIDEILPEGLSLFCGRPKMGKSWASLDMALSIAEGGQWLGKSCVMGSSLTLALEDNQRRLKSRLEKIRPNGEWPKGAAFTTVCPRVDAGGTDAVERWLDQTPDARLVTVDTLACVKPVKASGASDYQADYTALRDLHRIAGERGVAVMVIHHVRKAASDSGDLFDTVSGSTGLTGAADTTLLLTKRTEDGGSVLYGRGRDIAEFEYGVEFDADRCRWKMLGDADHCFLSDTRKRIIDAMATGAETPALIADRASLNSETVKKTLSRMVADGQAKRPARGRYVDALAKGTPLTLSRTSLMSRTDNPEGPQRDTRDVSDTLSTPIDSVTGQTIKSTDFL